MSTHLDFQIKHLCSCVGVRIEGDIVIASETYSVVDDPITVRKAGEARLECNTCTETPHCRCIFEGITYYYRFGDVDNAEEIMNIRFENYSDKVIVAEATIGSDRYAGFAIRDIYWRPRYWTEAQAIGSEDAPCFKPASEEWQEGVMYTNNYDLFNIPQPDIILYKESAPAEFISLYISKNDDICKTACITKNYIEADYTESCHSDGAINISFPTRFCNDTNSCYPGIDASFTGRCPETIIQKFPWIKDGYVEYGEDPYSVDSLIYNVFRKPYYDELDFLESHDLDGLDVGRGSTYLNPIIAQNTTGWWHIDYPYTTEPECAKKYVVCLCKPCGCEMDSENNCIPDAFFSFNPGDVHPITGKVLEGYLTVADFPVPLRWNFPCAPITPLDYDDYKVLLYEDDNESPSGLHVASFSDLVAQAGHHINFDGHSIHHFSIYVRKGKHKQNETEDCRNAAGLPLVEDDWVFCCSSLAFAPTVGWCDYNSSSWAIEQFTVNRYTPMLTLGYKTGTFYVRYIDGYVGSGSCINCMNRSNWNCNDFRGGVDWGDYNIPLCHAPWTVLSRGFVATGGYALCDCNQTLADLEATLAQSRNNSAKFFNNVEIGIMQRLQHAGEITFELRQVCNFVTLPGYFI